MSFLRVIRLLLSEGALTVGQKMREDIDQGQP